MPDREMVSELADACQCRPGQRCRLCELHNDDGELGEQYRRLWPSLWSLDVTQLRSGTHQADDPPCGVVIGTYYHVALVELQIIAIHTFCGLELPILVSDDCSPRTEEIEAICRRHHAVDFVRTPRRLGHVPGDLAAYAAGVEWAAARKLSAVVKISQRWICTLPRWVQNAAIDMHAAGAFLGGNCDHDQRFPLRCEAAVLDVGAWHQAEVLERFRGPIAGPAPNAEGIIWSTARDLVGGPVWEWPLVSDRRLKRTRGVLWHCDTPEQDYRTLGGYFGVDLGPAFTCASSDHLPDYKVA